MKKVASVVAIVAFAVAIFASQTEMGADLLLACFDCWPESADALACFDCWDLANSSVA